MLGLKLNHVSKKATKDTPYLTCKSGLLSFFFGILKKNML